MGRLEMRPFQTNVVLFPLPKFQPCTINSYIVYDFIPVLSLILRAIFIFFFKERKNMKRTNICSYQWSLFFFLFNVKFNAAVDNS